MVGHAVWRAALLILLGVFLRSTGRNLTNWTFEDTLTQIGLGYGFLFALGFRSVREQWVAWGVIVVGAWAAFALYPLPAAGFDYAKMGVAQTWLETNGLSGFAAHWQKNTHFAAGFESWWLNLFPREKPFLYHGGGYVTLSFVPTLATMILGLLAGNVLRGDRAPRENPMVRDRGGERARVGRLARLARGLPGGETYLDAELGAVQRRVVLSAARGFLRGGRRGETGQVGVSAGRDWGQLHRGVSDRASLCGLHPQGADDPLRGGDFSQSGCSV